MAKWHTITLKEVIKDISTGRIVLPVIQRELVWSQSKIISLFETVLKGESFGGIMTVIDPAKREPLFEFRKFISHFQQGQLIVSKKVSRLEEETTYIIDGQQRLSAFYIGITGEYNNELLFFDLLSEWEFGNYNFEFKREVSKLPKHVDNHDGTRKLKPLWYSVSDLYTKFEDAGYDHKNFCDDFCFDLDETMPEEEKKRIGDNLYQMQVAFFNNPIVGLCGVPVNRNQSTIQNRLNIVHLFQKLNQGGTILSGLELMRSVLKAYSAENEAFLNEVKNRYSDIGFNQDEIIKLVFLLQDNHSKDIIEIDQTDSDFITQKGKRIKAALDGTRNFLKHANLYEYNLACRPSLIPLQFIAYHLFNLNQIADENLASYFDNNDTFNPDFIPIRNWFILSILNHTFQRGNGWDPNKTGRRKILEVVSKNKGKTFPTHQIFNVYKNHPLHKFDDKINETWDWLNWYERSLVIFLIYGKPSNFRQNDIDHIHPKSILANKGVEWNRINLLGNFQYLYYSDNRSKQDQEFGNWLTETMGSNETKMNDFLELHTIPVNRENWYSDRFEDFIEERRLLIFGKLNKLG
ncbi:MAG: DUF262 domain-containing protein [Prolixibacteraceae bacterium]|nr:DUF262 domain-containing protein [Prolixibacteraceae bacterium]